MLVEGGPALFAVAAVGLLPYGLSMLVLATHRPRRFRQGGREVRVISEIQG